MILGAAPVLGFVQVRRRAHPRAAGTLALASHPSPARFHGDKPHGPRMMPRMRRLVWLLLVLVLACGVGDGRAAMVRRQVSAAGAGAVTWTRTDSIYDASGSHNTNQAARCEVRQGTGVVPGLAENLSHRPRVRAMNYYYDAEGNRSSVIVMNSQGSQTRVDHLQWDRQNRLVGYAMFDAARRCVFEAAYGYDHRARRVYRAERDERNGGSGAWDAAMVTYLGGTSVLEFATNFTPPPGGWRYAGYDPYAEMLAAMPGSYGTFVAVTTGSMISPRSAMDGEAVPESATPRVYIARGVDMGGGVGGVLYTVRPGADGLRIHGADARGDVVSQVDGNGEVRWAASYAAYGTRVQEASAGGAPADRFRANSKEEDPTGLLNEGFRYRDLETGTFISRDPLGFVDGPNVYAYVRQNPWTMWDPHGLWGFGESNGAFLDGLWNFGGGVAEGACDAVVGIGTAIAHPIDTAVAVRDTAVAALDGVKEVVGAVQAGYITTGEVFEAWGDGVSDIATDPERLGRIVGSSAASLGVGKVAAVGGQALIATNTARSLVASTMLMTADVAPIAGQAAPQLLQWGARVNAIHNSVPKPSVAAKTTVDGAGNVVPVNAHGVPSPEFVPKPGVGPYVRPAAAGPTPAQRAAVQGQPCVVRGKSAPRMVADHIDPLVVEHYRTGTIDVAKQSSVGAVQSHCPSCSSSQGGQMSGFSTNMKKKLP